MSKIDRTKIVTAALAVVILSGLLIGLPMSSAVHGDDLFELGPAQGADILGDDNPANGPDWGFVAGTSDDGLFDASGNLVALPADGVDADFIMDQISPKGNKDDTTFAGGAASNKNNDAVSTWQWTTGSTPNKDDLSNVYVYGAINPDNNHLIIYAGFERLDPNGDSHVDLEFFQDEVALDESPPCKDSPGDASPCDFIGERTVGDVIVSMDFVQGGGIGEVTVREWDGAQYVLVGSETGEGCNPSDTICAFNNGASINGGPWPNFNSQAVEITNLPANAFTEFGVDVTAVLGETPCISTFMGKTRSSQSFTAELMDFAGPHSFNVCGASIEINPPSDTNSINEEHTFTVTVSKTIAGVPSPADDGTIVTVTLTPSDGATITDVVDNCASPGTVNGECTVTFTSTTAGTVTGHASADVTIGSLTFSVETDGIAPNSGDAVKDFIGGELSWFKDDNAGNRLAGATFDVCRTHDFVGGVFVDIDPDVCISVEDNVSPDEDADDGEFLLTDLPLGRYTVHETAAPAGYGADPDTETVELTMDSQTGSITAAFVNNRPILKITEFGYTNEPTGTPTSGVVSGVTTYKATVKNFGGATADVDISLTTSIPGGLASGTFEYVGSTGPAGVTEPLAGTDCVAGCTASWTGISVAPGATVTIEVSVEYDTVPDGTEIEADLSSTYILNSLTRTASGSPANITLTVQAD